MNALGAGTWFGSCPLSASGRYPPSPLAANPINPANPLNPVHARTTALASVLGANPSWDPRAPLTHVDRPPRPQPGTLVPNTVAQASPIGPTRSLEPWL